MTRLTEMQSAALMATLKRLNWLYGRGEVQSFVMRTETTGEAIAQCPYSAEHTFKFTFDHVNTVKALRHQSRLCGQIKIGSLTPMTIVNTSPEAMQAVYRIELERLRKRKRIKVIAYLIKCAGTLYLIGLVAVVLYLGGYI